MLKSVFYIIINLWIVFPIASQKNNYSFVEEENLYSKIADIHIESNHGMQTISSLYAQSPLIIAFVFTRCAGICNPMISNLDEQIRLIQPKEKYKVLVLSFDSTDVLRDMHRFAKQFMLESNQQWIFATTRQIETLKKSINFWPVWDSARQQFGHDALLVGVNEHGIIKKKLIGMNRTEEFKLMLKEINNQYVLSYPLPNKNRIFSCFNYNVSTGKRTIAPGMIIMLMPAFFTLALLCWFATKKQQR